MKIASEVNPPFRLIIGSDAYNAIEKNDLAKIEAAKEWKFLSISTDFPKGA